MGAGKQADGGTEKEKVLRKGKQVVTPSAQPASQPIVRSVLRLGCEKLFCHEQSRHVYCALCSMGKQGNPPA